MDIIPTTPTLLGLPRELRDQIYVYLIQQANTRKAPPSPPFAGKRHRGPDDIFYSLDRPISRWPNIALVNHQILKEVRENVSKQPSGKPAAELDLMAKGYCFYPTWTLLPGCIRRGQAVNLNVNLRIFSTEAFRTNDGWPRQPGTGFRTLLALLNNYLVSGPSLAPADDTAGIEPYLINVLSVDVTFHDLYTPDTWPATAQEILKMLRELASSGIPDPYVQKVKAVVTFDSRSRSMRFKQEWPVAETVDEKQSRQWRKAGFIFALSQLEAASQQ
ncbi:hypothetical protein KC332_g10725 [Hortaea werneckii]|uniref:Uncharacterized protein n=1 Tax=Hortaea werneckii TaxID=91943 RepID=A0A3M7IDX6_HORWE|nr:hypothetical protein KC350_g10964 [Hortaea werneckii]KAI6817265.1 hypothetical protein KC358_g10354 [Hortaea werneckii]KAI6920077.1 hypothetical protein KC348_g10481 [Hortaea werneckii]KAI6928784.1 hypothetical protein KC341_g11287 [Hortaea werneckii]KAI6962890.1 hypothetical protein KC321_g11518 [Hortaea werneckii]